MGDGVIVLLHLGFWVLWRESKRMDSCKLALEFVNQISKCEGFHLANWVHHVCYFVPVIDLFSKNKNNKQKKPNQKLFLFTGKEILTCYIQLKRGNKEGKAIVAQRYCISTKSEKRA